MAASISASLVRFQITGRPCSMMVKPWIVDSALRGTIGERSLILSGRVSGRHCTSCMLETVATAACTNSQLLVDFGLGVIKVLRMEEMTGNEMNIMSGMLLGDIDPATAKVAISILGPILSAFSFLFIIRIVMSWYSKLHVDKFPYVVAYAPRANSCSYSEGDSTAWRCGCYSCRLVWIA